MRAQAIVMPLPPRAGGDDLRQDARDRARRAPVPRDHPDRPGERPRPDGRPHPLRRSIRSRPTHATSIGDATRACRPCWSLLGVAMLVAHARARRRPARDRHAARRAVRRRRRRAPVRSEAAGEQRATRQLFRRGLGSPALFAIVYTSVASAIYFSLGVVADHALGLTPVVFLARGRVLRAGGDDVRRGRLAAPGPRRLDGLRALRLQRAVELRRRLGDPARLHDPDRGHGVLGDELPGRVLRAAGAAARVELAAVLRDHRLRRDRATSAASRTTRVNRIAALVVADLALQLADHRPRAGRRSSTPTRSPTRSTSATTPTWERRRSSRSASRRSCFTGPGVGVRAAGEVARRRGAGSAAGRARRR